MARILSPHALWTVARIEVKTLLRSWFFRILASLALGLLVFVNLAMFTDVFHMPWMFRGISSAIPYFNIILLNLVQAVVASFLASDFLKRDRKLDSTDVVYSRSMSNGDYIIGKTIGILLAFGGLNAAVLVIALVFNGVFSGVPVALRTYLFYPLLISVPTLVYILGVSFILMAIIRSQAITLIVQLGYIGTALIYLGPQVHLIYDYMAFHFPMLYSGFVGFGDTAEILLHRGMYLFLGIACILATVGLLRRLPQSRGMMRLSRVLAVVFAAAAVTLGGLYLGRLGNAAELREGMRSLDDRLAGEPRISMKRCHLEVDHDGSEIRCTARITVRNETDRPIEHYRFILNPELTVTSAGTDGGELAFERELHIVRITPPGPLPPGEIDSLVLSYRGGIDDEACYLDVDDDDREELYHIAPYSVDKRAGFITPGYVLLTPETMWHPTPCIPFSPDRPIRHDVEFTIFSLDVTTGGALTALSQGAVTSPGGGRFVFSPETPLPGLTLCIGEYETRSVTVDSITYSLAMRTGHDAFTPHLSALVDTLPELIRELKDDYERRLELSYPFSRLMLVEVPVQFHGYPRLWTVREETVQPEMILLPERAANLVAADFGLFMDRPRRRGRQPTEQVTPREQQSKAFQSFVKSTIAGNIQRETGRRRRGMMEATYNIFPNYFSLVTCLRSDRLPILSVALESFIVGRIVQPIDPMFKNFIGLTGEEKANLALGEQSLEEILTDPERREIFSSVLDSKGEYLFVMLRERIGGEEFSAYLADIIARNRFRVIDAAHFMEDIGERYELDLEPYIDRWYRGRELPAYLMGDVAAYQVMDGDRTRFQVKFTASNTEPVDGLLRVTLRAGGRRRFAMGSVDEASTERIISLKGNETKECGIILDFKPRMMLVSTLVSRNIPVVLHTNFAEFELDERERPFDGERVLEMQLRAVEPGEIVVDNEDDGFEAGGKTTHGFLGLRFRQRSERDDEKYEGIRFWNIPDNRWVPVTHSDFFGEYVRSAVYTKAGKGDGAPASWKASIPESGTYEVYYYVTKMRRPWGRDSDADLGQYHLEIVHDDGADDVALDINEAENGWNYLGTYYLSSGEASVRLTNESSGVIVIADAVKWVKR